MKRLNYFQVHKNKSNKIKNIFKSGLSKSIQGFNCGPFDLILFFENGDVMYKN